MQRQQASANQVIRWLQQITAAVIVAIGFLAGGHVGLAIGTMVGLGLIFLRIDLYSNSK